MSFLEKKDAFADRNRCSCRFLSGCERKLIAITPLPHIEVDEVYPGHGNTNQHLAFLGYGSGNLPPVHNLGTTSFRELNCLRRDLFLCVISTALLTGVLVSASNPSMTCEETPSTQVSEGRPEPVSRRNRALGLRLEAPQPCGYSVLPLTT